MPFAIFLLARDWGQATIFMILYGLFKSWSFKIKLLAKRDDKYYFVSIVILITILIKLISYANINLIAEESYYWNYANHLDFSYLDHPPMVAFLIKISTLCFGLNEFSIRLPSILCWIISSFFIYKLTNRINPSAGIYSVFLMAILPFSFVQSLIITPDLPLMAAWSACLYYLYIVLTTSNNKKWMQIGIAFGIGLISKYTIVLLVPAILIYLAFIKNAYKKLFIPQPYIAALIAICIFSPVIYWNSQHEWVSFLFQSTRRFNEANEFSLHAVFGLFILFLTPFGVLSFINMLKKTPINIDLNTKRFLQIFTLTPLLFFTYISMSQEVKFNWIGPSLLSIIPWIALEISELNDPKIYKKWMATGIVLTIIYSLILLCINLGQPKFIYQHLFSKFINWNNYYQQIDSIATNASLKFNKKTVLIPLDKYNIASELSYYQAKNRNYSYQIIGRSIFGQEDLMYKAWSDTKDLNNKNILLISDVRYIFDAPHITSRITALSPVKTFWVKSQGANSKVSQHYYQIVQFKD